MFVLPKISILISDYPFDQDRSLAVLEFRNSLILICELGFFKLISVHRLNSSDVLQQTNKVTMPF